MPRLGLLAAWIVVMACAVLLDAEVRADDETDLHFKIQVVSTEQAVPQRVVGAGGILIPNPPPATFQSRFQECETASQLNQHWVRSAADLLAEKRLIPSLPI